MRDQSKGNNNECLSGLCEAANKKPVTGSVAKGTNSAMGRGIQDETR